MNRKHFVGATVAWLASMGFSKKSRASLIASIVNDISPCVIPEYLHPGDTIGIVSPAGFITHADIQLAINKIEEWGFKVKIGSSIGKRDYTFGGTDTERAADLQEMLDNDGVKAILCARGGYGLVRILDQLSFKKFLKNPRWIIGFSDATYLHNHLNKNFRIASIHSKMCNSFPKDWGKVTDIQKQSIESIGNCLRGINNKYEIIWNDHNRIGVAEGELVGGNLSIIENTAGTLSDLDTRDKILFLEDADEYMYSIDRMLWNLKRTGKLDHLKGLIIGGFRPKEDDPGEEFCRSVEELVMEKVKAFHYPVCFDFPVGHQKNNYALICGKSYRLSINPGKVLFE